MAKDEKYFNFPIKMLQTLHDNPALFYEFVSTVGIYLFAQTLEGHEENRFKYSCDFFEIKWNIKASTAFKKATDYMSHLYGSDEGYKKAPSTGLNKDMYWDFRLHVKTEWDIICLAAFLGIKSIIGTKPYCKTNKGLILARMFGYNTVKDMPVHKYANPAQKKYFKRWHMDKLLIELQLNWHLKLISNHQRGMYISLDESVTLDQLAELIIKRKQDSKEQILKDQKRRAIEKAKATYSTLTAH
jgi:hypothetical protein